MKTKRLLPPSTIGIIGGGQLAYYMAIEALNMGYKVHAYDPNPKAPAQRVTNFTCANFDDEEALIKFCEVCDVITYEFENMNLEHMETIERLFNLPQGAKMLRHTAHRYEELKMAQSLNIPTVKSVYVKDGTEVSISSLSLPLIVKTCRFGYDGKGQQRIYELEELTFEPETLISELIDFEKEISVLLVRSNYGTETYPCLENVHKHSILHTSTTLDKDLYPKAAEYAKKIAEAMDYIGIMAVEFFVKDGELIFNEVAPRPHNSGHLTLTVANKSQFKAHIEAITGHEVGDLYYYEHAVMLNLLGQDLLSARKLMGHPNTYHYEYGKDAIVHNRKMGHVTFTNNTNQLETYKRELNHE